MIKVKTSPDLKSIAVLAAGQCIHLGKVHISKGATQQRPQKAGQSLQVAAADPQASSRGSIGAFSYGIGHGGRHLQHRHPLLIDGR